MHFWMFLSLCVCEEINVIKQRSHFLYFIRNLLFLIPTSIALSHHWRKNNVSNFAYNCAITASGKKSLEWIEYFKIKFIIQFDQWQFFFFYRITLRTTIRLIILKILRMFATNIFYINTYWSDTVIVKLP